MASLPHVARMQKAFPTEIEVMIATHTLGGWGIKTVIPGPEEVEELRKYYTQKYKLTVPIAVWEGEKRLTEDGGMVPAPDPTWAAYNIASKPQAVLVDHQGIVRQVFSGFSRDDEWRAKRTIARL